MSVKKLYIGRSWWLWPDDGAYTIASYVVAIRQSDVMGMRCPPQIDEDVQGPLTVLLANKFQTQLWYLCSGRASGCKTQNTLSGLVISTLIESIEMLYEAYPRQITFPVELICYILGFLGPREIVLLRRISKQFRDITYDATIWKTVYANACLPRPPGPFPSQSSQFLEHTLVQSEQLAKTWTSHPIKIISRVLGPTRLTILWDGDVQPSYFDACAVTSKEGQRIYIMLRGTQLNQGNAAFGIFGQWPFLCIGGHLVWDMRTRTFHRLPPFSSALDVAKGTSQHPQLILTKTHIIAVYRWHNFDPTTTIFHAYVVPDLPYSAGDGICELRLTHEASMKKSMDPFPSFTCLMRNSVSDPVAGVTNLRFLTRFQSRGHTQYSCIDLTLPGHELSPRDVLPMSVDMQDLFTIDGAMQESLTTSSDDGHLRGFCSGSALHGTAQVSIDCLIWKFSVDASKERCVAVLGEPCPMASIDSVNFAMGKCEFDGVRGRICYTKREERKEYRDLVVVDLQ
ncbi:hypothetical protein BS17DRAFT_768166 [Gyrodon lividus]|nr:hypothetical protein BS17DRAFT_768166 [Gyrodon lividus]